MTESELQLLKEVKIPGKIFYSALYPLSKSSIGEEPVPPVNNNMEVDEVIENVFTVEEDDDDDMGWEGAGSVSQKEGEPADKAVKADDSAVPEHLWDDCIITKLTDHWKEKGLLKKKADLNNPVTRFRFCRGLRKLCRAVLKFWKRKVQTDFNEWFRANEDKWSKARRSAILQAG